jgi:hypothetical protein
MARKGGNFVVNVPLVFVATCLSDASHVRRKIYPPHSLSISMVNVGVSILAGTGWNLISKIIVPMVHL